MANLSGSISRIGTLTGNVSLTTAPTGDYNRLTHKPSINGVELIENITSQDLAIPVIYYGTTEEWDSHIELLSERRAIYIYTDYKVESEVNLPAIKIGDGTTYLIDLPFVTANTSGVEHIVNAHIANANVHVSLEDRAFWNSKHKAIVGDNETLMFTEL